MNKVIMMGRICNDLELKITPSGTNVCSFRIAVDRNYQVKGEEKKTDFFNVVAWRTAAEFVTRYFAKGRMILIEGEMQTRQYTDKNGNPATWYEIIADKLHFTGEKNNNGSAQEPPPLPPEPPQYANKNAPPEQPSSEPSQSSPDFAATDNDEYPF
ncbi:MAG: single-stranded DNA-binding protein [Oscillospiraceae bacterium]|nr:single-stranded DNA-binding protein [Oscillospiraceae bacterium]